MSMHSCHVASPVCILQGIYAYLPISNDMVGGANNAPRIDNLPPSYRLPRGFITEIEYRVACYTFEAIKSLACIR